MGTRGPKTYLYGPRIRGDIDLGYEPSRVNSAGNQGMARMTFPGTLLAGNTAAEINTSGTTQKYPIGTRMLMDERVFRYGLIGGAAAVGGRAVANLSTNEQSTAAPATYAVGATTVTITAAAGEDIAANALQGGYLCYKATRYFQHRILSNTAATAGNVSTLVLETPLVGVGITITTTTLCAYASPWAKVGFGETYGSGVSFVGWPYYNMAIGQYTWLQTWGPASGAPAAFFGDTGNQRAVWFASDGSLTTFSSAQSPCAYQYAGFWMPCTYWTAALHAMSDGGHLLNLQIWP